jgi:hypothetical protein
MPGRTEYKRHGGAYDRGSADYYYGRPRKPHYYIGGTNNSPSVTEQNMTEDEVKAYNHGYDDAELDGDQKNYA